MKNVYLYTFHERVWHWVQALVIMLLMWTGMEIHNPQFFNIIGFEGSVSLHNLLGFALIANALLGLLYHIFTEEVLQYIPEPRGFFNLATKQALYYARGIFMGDDHPIDKNPDNKLNPLQKITYLLILNILLPVQLISGLLIWGAQRWPEMATKAGGLIVLAPLHTLIAWFFGAFLIIHVYLATTGHTVMSNFQAMITGWEEVPEHESQAMAAPRRYGLQKVGRFDTDHSSVAKHDKSQGTE
jgi:thiosulfate reductase cytochrome b subunit